MNSVMPADPSYLRVRNWHAFQHYTGRKPVWIKNYLDLDDPSSGFRELTYADQGLLQAIWRLAAKCDNFIPDDTTHLCRALGARESHVRRACAAYVLHGWLQRGTRKELERLVRAEKRAAKPKKPASKRLAKSLQDASPETETETEEEKERTEQGAALEDLHKVGNDLALKLAAAPAGTVDRLYEICDTVAANTHSVIALEAETLTPDTLERVRAEALATPGERIRRSRTALVIDLLKRENRRAA